MSKVLLAMVAVAAISGASCSSPDASGEFGRYRVSVEAPGSQIESKPGEKAPQGGVVNGTLEVAGADESACLTLTGLRFIQASLASAETTVATFLLSESEGGNICGDAPAEELRGVVQHPDRYQLTVELVDGTIVESELTS